MYSTRASGQQYGIGVINIITNRALIDQILKFDIKLVDVDKGHFEMLTFDIGFEIQTLTFRCFEILTLTLTF